MVGFENEQQQKINYIKSHQKSSFGLHFFFLPKLSIFILNQSACDSNLIRFFNFTQFKNL